MSEISAIARVVLEANGKQPEQELKNLKARAKDYADAMANAAKSGDKVSYEKFRKELRKVEREIKNIESSTKNVELVMSRLDKSSPKELKETLRTLERQLQKIDRGSAAWEKQKQKIKMVKAELEKINSEMRVSSSLWDRLNLFVNNCSASILGFMAALGGAIAIGRSAVQTYAEMAEQMANTRKYTGLSVEEVEKLNKAFENMGTRTGREKLNELAQEAGRLGMNTLDAVKEYVEAAEIINVALVDLGEGATQTIAKLTNIFGVQEMLGVRDSMLAVGSTVNVLSQNCTASKPYLVEFAQRMAGIGAQAGLTIPQIIAFGAVLDANGQKVEMSATAIQKVIMNLANKNKEFANIVGLDADNLNATLKRSAKDGLLMFLEALKRIGSEKGYENATMSLAPAFKEMGLDAARVSMVLSTLSQHLDELKWQLGEADKAFNEATSATKEYEIFNNTALATIEKAKARFRELVIELGGELMPVMKHTMTSTSAMVRLFLTLVKWIKANTTLIMSITSAIAAYTLAVKANTIAVALNNGVQKISEIGFKVLKPAILACRLAYARLTNQTLKAAAAQRLLNQSMKVNVYAVVLAALVALAVWMKRKHDQDLQAIKDAREKAKAEEEFKKSLTNVEEEAEKNSKKELYRLEALYSAAVSEVKEREERIKAVEKLQELYPEYFKSLTAEEIMAGKAAEAYDKLKVSILEASRARAAQSKYDENMSGWIDADSQLNKLQKENERLLREQFTLRKTIEENSVVGEGGQVGMNAEARNASQRLKIVRELLEENNQLMIEQQNLMEQYESANQELMTWYGISTVTGESDGRSKNGFTSSGSSSAESEKNEDKFKKEKEWREKQEALAKIAYARGEIDYIEYTEKMNMILLDFYEKQLSHTDLSESERLSITAQFYEQNNKIAESANARSIKECEKTYNEEIAILKQYYADGYISKEVYDSRMLEIEIEYQRNLVFATVKGTKERLEAEQKLSDLLIRDMERRKSIAEKKESEINKIKSEYFGDNLVDRQANYDRDMSLLEQAYERELQAVGDVNEEKLRIDEAYEKAKIALKKKYGLEAEEVDKNAVRNAVNASVEWLNSDGGKAVTGTMDVLVSGMASIFSQMSTIIQAELEMQTAAITKKYDAELSAAEGNSYRVAKLEKQKEKEIAKAKAEANRKQFNMQVIQAVAQTAQGAISAYSSAAATPIVGWLLAPVAASLAIAAGMLQVQAIKKQQQASEAQGYSEGGFTGPGAVDEPAGMVHKGEWVASQKLVNSPKTRPLIDSLERAQRTNTIGSFKGFDAVALPVPVQNNSTSPIIVSQNSESMSPMGDILSRLAEKLEEPFVTVNTVTGDVGIKKAQDEYEQLMRNKTPKSRRK